VIAPGETIGILGGGQLGRMLAMAAAQLGYRCHIYAPEADSIAAEVAPAFTCAGWDDAAALARFAADCAVITYEFENVPVAPLAALGETAVLPHPRALETAQDRLAEKDFAAARGGRPAAHAAVDGAGDLERAIAEIGSPGILKTRRDGYDGKGQWPIAAAADAATLALPPKPLIYERRIAFLAEFSVLLVRGGDGDVRFWDSPENVHAGGILARSTVPPSAAVAAQVAEAQALAGGIAEALDYIGVLCCEFFATAEGPVFNEMAPRVHNSGHWTIEGAVTSQFENHIRAICGLPLGATHLIVPSVEMRNVIGANEAGWTAEDWPLILSNPANHLHLYGKAAARPGRKMGHVTRLGLQ
jgi:5-(carboxyamino)imidazole ribonucleotide synthase